MSTLTKQLKGSLERRTNLVQIRVSDSEKALIDNICESMDIRINKLGYELFRYGLEQYKKENPKLIASFEAES